MCICLYQHSIICYLLQAENQIMSMSNTDKFAFEKLQLWNSARLKDYLGDRRLSVTRSIEKLRATVLASTLCKYDLRKGDFFVLSWARVRRVRRGSISSMLLVCVGGVRRFCYCLLWLDAYRQ